MYSLIRIHASQQYMSIAKPSTLNNLKQRTNLIYKSGLEGKEWDNASLYQDISNGHKSVEDLQSMSKPFALSTKLPSSFSNVYSSQTRLFPKCL